MLASVEADEADGGEGRRKCGVGGSGFMVDYSTVIQSVWGSRVLSKRSSVLIRGEQRALRNV